MRGLTLGLLLLWPLGAMGQSYPDYAATTVNDFANLLPPDAEARVAAQLDTLRAETGVEMTLVTLPDMAITGPLTLEMYATALFDRWGVGNAARNDGVMLLVFRNDRELRIELGKAYGLDWDWAAQNVMDDIILPPYRDRREAEALEAGMSALETDLVRPFLAGADAPKAGGGNTGLIVLAVIAAFFGLGGVIVGYDSWTFRRRPCTQCGQTGLHREKITLTSATRFQQGQGLNRITCPHCNHVDSTPFIIAMLSDSSSGSSGGSFGGGSSGGGGASGHG